MSKKAGTVKKPRLGVIAKNSSSSKKNLIFILLFILLYIGLFIFLKDKLLFTPDFGESDAYHLNLSLKYYLAENLKHNTLPFWTDKLQGGFPLFSEGQIGSLFLPNIVFLKFLPFADAYNLLLIFSLFCLSLGFYFLLKEFKINSLPAFLFSLIFTFNGAISLRWVHLNLIQSFSLTPLLFFSVLRYLKTNKKAYLILSPFLISQMIFAGHTQAVFISLFALFCWYILYIYFTFKRLRERMRYWIYIVLAIVSGITIALPQLLPTYILTNESSRSLQLGFKTATDYPFFWKEIVSFISPFALGNPKIGTYPPFSEDWGIFWENTPYLGLVFFLVIIFSLILNFKKIIKDKGTVLLFLLVFFFLLLTLGKNSPLYLVFYLPPFSFFRNPSKYLLVVNLFLIFASALITDQIFIKLKNPLLKVIITALLVWTIVGLFQFAFQHHLFINKDLVLEKPDITKYLNQNLYMSIGQPNDWNKIFINKGWQKKDDIDAYLFLKNYLYPDSNLFARKRVYDINTGAFRLKRPDYLHDLIFSNLFKNSNNQIIIHDNLINLFQILGINNLIVPYQINNVAFKNIKRFSDKNYQIYLYQMKNNKSTFFYIPKTLRQIRYMNDFEEAFYDNLLSIDDSLIEDVNFDRFVNNQDYTIKDTSQTEYESTLKGDFKKPTFIVFRENFYPEWSVYIDGKKVPSYKVNLTHIGASVPLGSHKIILKYENRYFKMGLLISGIYSFLYSVVIFYLGKKYKLKNTVVIPAKAGTQ